MFEEKQDFRFSTPAVNHSGDSDSTGAIFGNIVGAAYGRGSIPNQWLDELELKNVIEEVAGDLFAQVGA